MDTNGNLFNIYGDVDGQRRTTPLGNVSDLTRFKVRVRRLGGLASGTVGFVLGARLPRHPPFLPPAPPNTPPPDLPCPRPARLRASSRLQGPLPTAPRTSHPPGFLPPSDQRDQGRQAGQGGHRGRVQGRPRARAARGVVRVRRRKGARQWPVHLFACVCVCMCVCVCRVCVHVCVCMCVCVHVCMWVGSWAPWRQGLVAPSSARRPPSAAAAAPSLLSPQLVPPASLVEGMETPRANPWERLLGPSRRSFPYDRPEVDFQDPRPYEQQLFDQVCVYVFVLVCIVGGGVRTVWGEWRVARTRARTHARTRPPPTSRATSPRCRKGSTWRSLRARCGRRPRGGDTSGDASGDASASFHSAGEARAPPRPSLGSTPCRWPSSSRCWLSFPCSLLVPHTRFPSM